MLIKVLIEYPLDFVYSWRKKSWKWPTQFAALHKCTFSAFLEILHPSPTWENALSRIQVHCPRRNLFPRYFFRKPAFRTIHLARKRGTRIRGLGGRGAEGGAGGRTLWGFTSTLRLHTWFIGHVQDKQAVHCRLRFCWGGWYYCWRRCGEPGLQNAMDFVRNLFSYICFF